MIRRVPSAQMPPVHRTAMRGIVSMVYWRDGRVTVKKWPRKRGPKKTPDQAFVVEQFAQVSEWARNPTPQDRIAAGDLAVGTPYTWRDLYFFACYGKLIRAHLTDGRLVIGARMAYGDIQALLDSISREVGTILTRNQTEWIAILPGTANQILTTGGPGTLPSWQDNSGGTGAKAVPWYWPPSPIESTNYIHGSATCQAFAMPAGAIVDGIGWWPLATSATLQWQVALYAQSESNPLQPGALLHVSDVQTGVTSGQWAYGKLQAQYLAETGKTLFAALWPSANILCGKSNFTGVFFTLSALPYPDPAPSATETITSGTLIVPCSSDPGFTSGA